MNKKIAVNLISTFGPETRGVSPYSDSLASALSESSQISLRIVDFRETYPSFLHPGQAKNNDISKDGIHFANPRSWKLAFSGNPDIIHLQHWTFTMLPILIYIARRAKKNGIKTIVTAHNPTPHESFPLIKQLENILFNSVDMAIVHTTEAEKILLSSRKLKTSKSCVIAHGAPSSGCNQAEQPSSSDYTNSGLDPNYLHILFFGNIRNYKGVDILLSSWNKICSNHPKVKLIIAGRTWTGENFLSRVTAKILGSYKIGEFVQNSARRKWPKNTIYKLDFIAEGDLQSIFKISQLAVFPYRNFNSQSGAAIAAASHGTPVLVSDEGGLSSLAIDESFICLPLTIDKLADKLDFLLTTNLKNYRTLQLKKLKAISWENVSTQHIEAYHALFNAKKEIE